MLRPPVPLLLRPVVREVTLAGIALVPDDVLDLYGLRLGAMRNAAVAAGRQSVRRLSLARALPGIWTADGHGLALRLLTALS